MTHFKNEKRFTESVIKCARQFGWLVHHVPYYSQKARPYPGFPDILLIKTGHAPLFAELKMPNGKLSPAQEVWAMTLKIMPEVNYYIWRPKDWDKIIDILTSEPHYNEP